MARVTRGSLQALFLQHIGFDVSAESCLCNMFADNAELCLQVDPEAVSAMPERAPTPAPRSKGA